MLTKAEQETDHAVAVFEQALAALADPTKERQYVLAQIRAGEIEGEDYMGDLKRIEEIETSLHHPDQNRKPNHPQMVKWRRDLAFYRKRFNEAHEKLKAEEELEEGEESELEPPDDAPIKGRNERYLKILKGQATPMSGLMLQ